MNCTVRTRFATSNTAPASGRSEIVSDVSRRQLRVSVIMWAGKSNAHATGTPRTRAGSYTSPRHVRDARSASRPALNRSGEWLMVGSHGGREGRRVAHARGHRREAPLDA